MLIHGTSSRQDYGKEREPGKEQSEFGGMQDSLKMKRSPSRRASKRGFGSYDLQLAHWHYVLLDVLQKEVTRKAVTA